MVKTENILKDPKHWIGWILTTAAIIGVFHMLGVHLHTDWIQPTALFLTVVSVDYIKHEIGLQ